MSQISKGEKHFLQVVFLLKSGEADTLRGYTPEVKHGSCRVAPWNFGDSYWKPSFSGWSYLRGRKSSQWDFHFWVSLEIIPMRFSSGWSYVRGRLTDHDEKTSTTVANDLPKGMPNNWQKLWIKWRDFDGFCTLCFCCVNGGEYPHYLMWWLRNRFDRWVCASFLGTQNMLVAYHGCHTLVNKYTSNQFLTDWIDWINKAHISPLYKYYRSPQILYANLWITYYLPWTLNNDLLQPRLFGLIYQPIPSKQS